MLTHWKMMTLIFAGLCQFFGTAHASDLEVKDYRFRKHSSQKYERLVLEFAQQNVKGPEVKLTQAGSGGDASIEMSHSSLVGAIPEASINESYVSGSQYLGPISVSTDTPEGGFTIRTYLKSPNIKLDAFWLSSPSRLVIDAFPHNSPRAHGLSAPKRHVAQAKAARSAPKTSKSGYVCFPGSTQVGLKVSFRSIHLGNSEADQIPIDLQRGKHGTEDGIVCYPRSAEVNPQIGFSADPFAGVDDRRGLDIPSTTHHKSHGHPQPVGAHANTVHNQSTHMQSAAKAPAPHGVKGHHQPTSAGQHQESGLIRMPSNAGQPPALPSNLKSLPPAESGKSAGSSPHSLLPPLPHSK